MTIAIPMHRALSTKLAGRSFNVVTRLGYNPWLARVNHDSPSNNESKPSQPSSRSSRICFVATRSYATSATAKPVGRPKAHTGRTPAKRTRTAAPKKPGPKTAAGKKAVGRKPKPKPKAKKAPAKPKPKPRKPAVKKVPSKTALNQARIAKEKAVKEKALLDTPKKLSETPWTIIFAEAQTGSKASEQVGNAKSAGEKFKNLTPEEKEHYNHLAHTNKEKNDKAIKQWLSQFTPTRIREANNARRQLRAEYRAKNPKAKQVNKFPLLSDDRLVKRPTTAYVQFSTHRHASGDFHNMTIVESSKLIGREWKALSAAEKKTYYDQAKADLDRYDEEASTVYGSEHGKKTRKSTSKSPGA